MESCQQPPRGTCCTLNAPLLAAAALDRLKRTTGCLLSVVPLQYTYYKPINDHYRAYNKPGGVIDYLAQHTPQEEWVIIIDSDTFIRHPFTPEELPAEPGWAYGSDHSFLYGINNGMALRHVPEIAPR
jgi:hypothetical protein